MNTPKPADPVSRTGIRHITEAVIMQHPETDSRAKATILAVDDTAENLALMSGLLKDEYKVKLAPSGEKCLRILQGEHLPDLILLDVMMPDMDGYEVCRRIIANPETRHIPVIFLTAKGSIEDEQRGFELGAADYISKPISPPIVMARVRSQLALRRQSRELAEWNRTLNQRVNEAVSSLERLGKLRRFFSSAVAELLMSSSEDDLLVTRRRDIVVLFLDLRGYTAFSEAVSAEEVMSVLAEYHAAMGVIINQYGATLERFTGDGMMVFLNDPIEIPDPVGVTLAMALAMQAKLAALATGWEQRGYSLSVGIGVAKGIATIGAIGFDGRRDYGAIGPVTNLSARLCGAAKGGQILVSDVVAHHAGTRPGLRSIGPHEFKGFGRPIEVFELTQAEAQPAGSLT